MTLWTAAEATRATGGTTNTDWTASGVSIDSRSLQPGDLFVALNAARDGFEQAGLDAWSCSFLAHGAKLMP